MSKMCCRLLLIHILTRWSIFLLALFHKKKHPEDVKLEIRVEKQHYVEESKKKDEEEKLQVVIEKIQPPTGSKGGVPENPEMKERQDFVRNVSKAHF